ncbi:MAG: DNA topoisomerase IV subunit A [Rhodospirillaceae bacterium]|jgi:topoisomerase IV subunit A|nr:DNA topoisomerase IV subunit A [Rhodospirillaceae bacterium]MBT5752480.1 DNA topoisomerase IV subunit A [Rhodospirillaceae bacterium]
MSKTPRASVANVRDAPLAEALGERYLSYALSTITSRSLPDVRDGLKPVHRRLLYAMQQLKLDPKSGYKKCARVVGDVIGKYHPHGDVAVYDAMVRLAQDFAQRYMLVEGHGNFGNIDGDNAAAMRYTEARLTEIATTLLDGLSEDAVDFRPTYDGEEEEPVVLPAGFPNLLANGATGIAVGMATSIPPHNAGEICDALIHLIKFPNATMAKLVGFMPGPDFPTGGTIVEAKENILEAYTKGRGGFRLRARWEKEELSHGQYQIVITEIPYQVQKSRLIEKIAELLHERKLAMLGDIRDESAADLRLIIEPKNRTVDAALLMESLYRQSDLDVRIPLNLNVLDADGTPGVMNLREVLQAFLDHRHIVLQRRTRHRLEKIAHRLEILSGYLIVYANLDAVIRIIRDEDEPKPKMMKKFKLTEVQAEAILDMRLRRLRKLDEIAIREEFDGLKLEEKSLKSLLKDSKKRWKLIGDEIADIKKRFGQKTEIGARRSDFGEPPANVVVPLEAMIEREPVTIICSEKGWVRATRGHLSETEEIKYKEGDKGRFALHAQTTDRLIIFATNGRFYTLGVDKLPGGRGHGEPLSMMIDLGKDSAPVALYLHDPARRLLVAATDGRGFIVEEKEVIAQTKNGKQVLNVKGDVEAHICSEVPQGGDHVAAIGENHKLILFPLTEGKEQVVPVMTRGRGVMLQKYKDGGLSDAKIFTLKEGLSWETGRGTTVETKLKDWLGKRAQAGRLAPKGFPKNNRF